MLILGEAGRGFTVVAQEVKALAGQVGRAAKSVGAQVGDVRELVDRVTANHSRVEEAIHGIAGLSSNIERAVAAQHDATRSIAEREQAAIGEIEAATVEAVEAIVARLSGVAVDRTSVEQKVKAALAHG